ncbi:MAG: flagellar hook-associated protein FlgK [Clostridiales bacterium]|jgi:flagellar hook-associated protein 1 FlgK|nr:flagellar hook-associated protein FlgK [Clostridiales bacterium]
MGKFSTLGTAVSGLNAAQTGLYVTGHNMANVDTVGFTRQQAMQVDFPSLKLGNGVRSVNQTGLGTNISETRQIRNRFLDISYRREAGKHDYYNVKATTGYEIEHILGDLQSDYNTDTVMKDLFNSLQDLSIDTQSLAARGTFVSTAVTFVDKVSNVYNRMQEYQDNLNEQIKGAVIRVNQLITSISNYNSLIMSNEVAGDNANDYRDARAVDIDELSHLLDIEYKENANGSVSIISEGKILCADGARIQLGLRYTGPTNDFVEPVVTTEAGILPWDEYAVTLFNFKKPINATLNNDSGKLKSLMVCRGFDLRTYADDIYADKPEALPKPAGNYPGAGVSADWDAYNQNRLELNSWFDVNHSFLPRMMKEFDTIVNKIVTLINDSVAPYEGGVKSPQAPYDLNYSNTGGVEIFSRRYVERFDGDTYNEEDPESYFTLYTSGNLMINPKLLEAGGYNLIALMQTPEPYDPENAVNGISDNTIVLNDLLAKWKSKIVSVGGGEELSIDDAYRQFTNILGVETSEAANFADEQAVLLVQVDNKRQSISAVSLDEEMRNMMMYQHAYNAAARVVNVVDSMIDKIVNGTGRVGL